MKVLSIEDIRKADAYTMANEPITSIDLMERAATNCFAFILKHFFDNDDFVIFAGPGNNGGDGLVIARRLASVGYRVKVFICEFSKSYSEDCLINLKRLPKDVEIIKLKNKDDIFHLSKINEKSIIIDALLGSGITRPPDNWLADLIKSINSLSNFKIAIDMPSGLFSDKSSKAHFDRVIAADITLTFEVPRLAFFMPENYPYIGVWTVLPIGLDYDFIDKCNPLAIIIDGELIKQKLKKREPKAYKNLFGHVCIAGGSPGKYGAALLSTIGALKSGAGLVTSIVPRDLISVYLSRVPEALTVLIDNPFVNDFSLINDYDVACIGPGLGNDPATAQAFHNYLIDCKKPTVLDADALNILSQNIEWCELLNENFILTPHPGELKRLLGTWRDDFEKIDKAKDFCNTYNCNLIIKEHNTKIINPQGDLFINITGNDTLSKGGSGDILAGLLAGLLAQKYSPTDASIIAVCLHGAAGEWCGKRYSHHATSISQLTDGIENIFLNWEQNDFSMISINTFTYEGYLII